jgi:2-keto-4-pentenoate hydratase
LRWSTEGLNIEIERTDRPGHLVPGTAAAVPGTRCPTVADVTPDLIEAAAAELLAMRAAQRVEADLPADIRPATLADGYAIQRQLVARMLPDGERRIGYKAACTSTIAQQALQVGAPLFGQLLSHSSHPSGATLAANSFIHRVIESEFAFRIGTDVAPAAGGHSVESVVELIDAVIPAIEIVDYRFADWTVGAPQVAADNAIHGAWISGVPQTDWRRLDLSNAGVVARRNGEVVSTGSGAAVLGHPLAVVAWLANELPMHGLRLQAGDVVTTGVTTGVFDAAAGDRIESEFDGVGSVSVSFT